MIQKLNNSYVLFLHVLVIAKSQAGRGPGQQNKNAQNYKGERGGYNEQHYSNRSGYSR